MIRHRLATIESPVAALAAQAASALASAYERSPAPSGHASAAGGLGLLDWGRRFLPDHFTKPPSSMHRWLAGRLDGFTSQRGQQVNVIGPRGSAKSTVATLAYVTRVAVEGLERYIWLVSDTRDQARSHLANIKRELTDNQQLAAAYPHLCRRGPVWRGGAIQLTNGVVIESFGAGQRLRGRRHGASRPTLIVCDDLQNDSHAASPRLREASLDWFQGTLLKAGAPGTNVVNLATALHRDALAMRLHSTPGWRSRLFKAIEQWPTAKALWDEWASIYCDTDNPASRDDAWRYYQVNRRRMDAGSRVLWPEHEDLYTLMRMRVESGVTAFEREKQGSPIDPERCEWPESYFGDGIWFDEWPPELSLRTLALDPSKGSDARQGDYSAIVLLGVDRSGVLHVRADLARRPTPQMVSDCAAHIEAFRPHAFGIEANQYQQLLGGELVAEFRRRGMLGATPCELQNHTNKQVRIRRLGPYLSQRRLRFLRGCESTRLLVDQLRDFPLGAHDDGPDALEMALRLAEQVWQGRRASRDDGLGDRLVVS